MNTENQLPTAAEARARINELNSAEVAAQWKMITQAINVAIDKGEEQISVTMLMVSNRNRLESMGYSCSYRQAGYNEYEWVIKW